MKTFLFAIAVLLYGCGECDSSKYYQVKAKNPAGDSKFLCSYKVVALGPCMSWQKSEEIYFTDSCSVFTLSQVVSLSRIEKYK
ncbi:hypothetical protein BH10BAC4_BH10BAC4_09250 [soil metagenome]